MSLSVFAPIIEGMSRVCVFGSPYGRVSLRLDDFEALCASSTRRAGNSCVTSSNSGFEKKEPSGRLIVLARLGSLFFNGRVGFLRGEAVLFSTGSGPVCSRI